MSTQATSTVVDVEVSTTADLSLQKDTRLADGYRIWVKAAGATHGLWCLDKSSAGPAGPFAVVTLSGVGFWVFMGAGGTPSGGGASVATLPALNTTYPNTIGLTNGFPVWVRSRQRFFIFQNIVTPTQDGEVLASTDGLGSWYSQDETTTPYFALVYAPASPCVVDPAAGNDDNDGIFLPLKTMNEFCRRIPKMFAPIQCNILSTAPDSDNFVFTPRLAWIQSFSATYPTLTLLGIRTVGGNLVVAASTNEAGNVPPTVTVAAQAWTAGQILQATSGAQNGATAVVISDLGAGVARTSPWRSSAGARVVPPAAADTIAITTRPTINTVSIWAIVDLAPTIRDLDIKSIRLHAGNTYNIQVCSFAGAQSLFAPAGGSCLFSGCSITTTGPIAGSINGSTAIYRICGMVKPNAITSLGTAVSVELTDCVLQGYGFDLATSGGPGGRLQIQGTGFITGTAKILDVRKNFNVYISGTFYGSGATTCAVDVSDGGHVFVSSTQIPTVTGAIELRIDNAGTAIPALAAGAAVPAASALTTWANWVAAPFSRNVVGYTSLSSITNSAP